MRSRLLTTSLWCSMERLVSLEARLTGLATKEDTQRSEGGGGCSWWYLEELKVVERVLPRYEVMLYSQINSTGFQAFLGVLHKPSLSSIAVKQELGLCDIGAETEG